MSRWRRSVDELAARRRQHECERAQDALSRVTSCFQQLVALVGSSADGSFLRDELDETRAVAHRICSGLSCRLLRSLSNSDFAPSGVQDRQVLERLWVLFLSALEHFLYDLRKACDLIGQFPLTEHSNRRSLVNTVPRPQDLSQMLRPQPGVRSVPHTSRYTSEDRTPPSGSLSHTSITPPITGVLQNYLFNLHLFPVVVLSDSIKCPGHEATQAELRPDELPVT
ncbi:regulator of G-protein signaling 9-binding protein-like [Pundamilia nyererei]|uniref:Regulator of G-protein signaling 9-binding protein-like n=1 Tax=Pundamilia nyererei TaxID=303518 RepID=A0A9Y6J8N7_9CICH|nr:PREDICTED: regulator of G-protein signaling 9-binding protein-like [Pundamilia nyererei]